MERELWQALYQLARSIDPAPWWSLGTFFRLRGRGRLSLGGVARPAGELGLSA